MLKLQRCRVMLAKLLKKIKPIASTGAALITVGSVLFIVKDVSDLKAEIIELRSVAHRADKSCALSMLAVEKVDQNYRNLKEYEVRNANRH